MIQPLPWKLIARIAVPVVVAVVCFGTGFKVANWRRDSLELAVVEAAEKASVASRQAAVSAISKIEVRNVVVRQQAETVVREVPIYTECRHDPRGLQAVNSALSPAGPDTGSVP